MFIALMLVAALTQGVSQAPNAFDPQPSVPACDATGVIHCQVEETVTASQSLSDLRTIAEFIRLVSERNLRHFTTWREKAPSAAFELVKRVHPFPYLPYGDTYGISDLKITLQESRNRILVRYPRRPDKGLIEPRESDFVIYDGNLAEFMKVIEKEIQRLKK